MIYFDNAATTMHKPPSVYRAMADAMLKNGASAGRGGYRAAMEAGELVYGTREALAGLFGIEQPERVNFTQNTTHALNLAIKGILKKGDHVIYSAMEHNSVVRPLKAMEQKGEISLSVLPATKNGEVEVFRLPELILRNTKLVCLTHSSNVCGTINDIYLAQEIAKKHGVYLLVDAAQSAGTLFVDASKLDMVAMPGHKGLMGPQGTGVLTVGEGISLAPLMEGGTGSLSESVLQPDFLPDRFESGTQNVPAIAGLGEAARWLNIVGTETIHKKETELCRTFTDAMRNIKGVTVYGAEPKTAICAMNIAGNDCVEVAHRLEEVYGIAVRSGLHCAYQAHQTLGTEHIGCVRFSFGFFNTEKEVKRAVDAIWKLSEKSV